MARLSAAQWEKVRADYEVRGISIREAARKFGVSDVAVGKKARAEAWIQGKSSHLVERKVSALKEIANIDEESSQFSKVEQMTIDKVARERLRAEGILAELDVALGRKAIALLAATESPDDVETLSRVRRNIAPVQPKTASETTVNVNQAQQQGQAQIQALSPRDALAELVRRSQAIEAGGG